MKNKFYQCYTFTIKYNEIAVMANGGSYFEITKNLTSPSLFELETLNFQKMFLF